MDNSNAIVPIITMVIQLAVIGLTVASWWVLFTKAGRPGWAAIVPIYNVIVFLDIIDKPAWHIIFFFIPCVNIYFAIVYTVQFAEKFGASTGFAVGLILLGAIFYPLLAFGDYPYQSGRKRITRRRDYDDEDDEDEDEDDRPRSRSRRRDDDDDDDDRPRKRRPVDDDDDDDDDAPPRRRR